MPPWPTIFRSGTLRRLAAFSAAMACPVAGWSEVRLPALFSDHLVLMRSTDVPVWGWSSPGETVTVRIGDASATTTGDASGHWRVKLNLSAAGTAPFSMIVKGTNEIDVKDVLVGAVWLSSGQSNMEFPLRGAIGGDDAIAHSANTRIRFFHVEKSGKSSPAEDCKGSWVVADPATSGAFSAIAYFFAKRLQADLHVPVGIVDNSWGGTISVSWISSDAIASVPELRDAETASNRLIGEYNVQRAAWVHNFGDWLAATGRMDKGPAEIAPYVADSVSPGGWKTITLPGPVADVPGVYWIRREVDVTRQQAISNFDFKLMLGPIEGFEQVYWNGVKVSETPYTKYPGTGYARYFAIPHAMVKDGQNTLALRIYSPGTPPKMLARPDDFWATSPIPLGGKWLVKTESTFPPLDAKERAAMPASPAQSSYGHTSTIFNGVVAPLVPFAIDGVIWYQGESDTPRAEQYRVTFPLLIEDWRKQWGRGDLPFLFCQITRSGAKVKSPGESEWAELRDAQTVALKLPRTAEAVLIDQGESGSLHPRQKEVVGERLAQIALADVYGKTLPHRSPTFSAMSIQGNAAEIGFQHVNGSLIARPLPATYDVNTLLGQTARLLPDVPGSELQGFAICGADKHWVWAQAKIVDKSTVRVWSDQVPHPVAVRYAWSDDPTVNLFDSAGLPAAPFRTDSFPAVTAGKLYGPAL